MSTLLQLMEDYDAPGLLVATTNVESSLDLALFRRFDDVSGATAWAGGDSEIIANDVIFRATDRVN